jgi:HD-GYP domain-containing protein (c-di-GMP phosphodiesterase class II)
MENTCTFSEETGTISCPIRFRNKSILLCIALIVLIVAGSGIYLYWSLDSKKKTLTRQIENQLQTLATSHATTISTWLETLIVQGKRLTDAEMFRIYCTTVDEFAGDISALILPERTYDKDGPMSEILTRQPLIQVMVEEFAGFSGFVAARVVNRKATPFLNAPRTNRPLSMGQKMLIARTIQLGQAVFSPLRKNDQGLLLDLFLPVFSPDQSGPIKTVAVTMFTINATTNLNEILSLDPGRDQGEHTLLIEQKGDGFREVVPWLAQGFRTLEMEGNLMTEQGMNIRQGTSFRGKNRVYALGQKIPQLDLWVVEEIDESVANKDLRSSMLREIVISVLMTLIACLALVLVWWAIMERERRSIALEFKTMADENERQKNFLDTINATIPELIGLKDNGGRYTYVNQTFAATMGKDIHEVIGLDDGALFGFDTGRRLKKSDNDAMARDTTIGCRETVFIQSQKHIFQINKVPFRDEHNERSGILCVYRDVTIEAEHEKKAEKLVNQTISALVKAVEMSDPYLAGHSQMLKLLAAKLADSTEMNDDDRKTLDIAATLSQIGKLFVDRNLLAKPGKLSDEERKAVEQHVEFAADMLDDIDFGLPVRETVVQSNEFLDGSGYPKGLVNNEITPLARILCVLNTFCALIKPRSYRAALAPDQAMAILKERPDLYDQNVVKALESLLPDPDLQSLLAEF